MDTLSLWRATANPHKERAPLDGVKVTDVVIVGAGFTGLSTAYHLQKKGYQTIVMEQETIGWGASGRNGGQVLTGYKEPMGQIAKKWGMAEAKQLNQLSTDSLNLVRNIVEEHRIDCSLQNCGHLAVAYKKKHMDGIKREMEFLNKYFGYETRVLEKEELASEIRSQYYHGALVDPCSYSFHPLNYVLGLADAAESLGATIYERTRAESIERTREQVTVVTRQGKVKAKEIVMATDAYSAKLTKTLNQSVLPVASYIVATEPLPKELLSSLIPNNRMIFDTSHFVNYFRRTPDGRIAFGGGDIMPTSNERVYQKLHSLLLTIFPQLEGYKIDYRWGGLIGITRDMFPTIGKMEQGIYFATGYCGHGASLATLMGQLLAQCIGNEEHVKTRFEQLSLKKFPLYNQKTLLINLASSYFRLLDFII